ncbi:MAG TPA: COX15/CtaA family protein [Candidatus Binataceae bacterium]|nr:COX15/CtaA family protein [Candidatus Binataceae bacterium]
MAERTIVVSSPSGAMALHRYAILCAAATFALIFVGGLVTSTGSALAVPDWPLAFGKLIPPLQGGIRFEWGHRVVAGTVSIMTLILAIWTWYAEPRRWVRMTALAAFALVVVQAILGGITVLLLLPLPIAVAHAATGQAVFCLMVALAIFTNPRFSSDQPIRSNFAIHKLTRIATVTTVVIYLQILVGAVMRHLGAGLAIPDFPTSFGHLVPPFLSIGIDVNFAHRCGALVVTGLVLWTFTRVMWSHRTQTQLRNAALLLLALLVLQVSLGMETIWSGRAVLPTTAHVAIGAAVLATSMSLTIRAYVLGRVPHTAAAAMQRLGSIRRQVSA